MLFTHPEEWKKLPALTEEWLRVQSERSELPQPNAILAETFLHEKLQHLVFYTFAGRKANQTLGLLLTQRMESDDLLPLGFVASDYALAVWGLREVSNPQRLLREALAAETVNDWIAKSQMSKRAFREVAVIAGLVERNLPGKRKTGRQVTVSTDLIYEVLMRHEPEHILLRATRDDIENRIADIDRLNEQLGPLPVSHRALDRASPLAIPLLLEIGIERVRGKGEKELLSLHDIETRRAIEGDRLLEALGVKS